MDDIVTRKYSISYVSGDSKKSECADKINELLATDFFDGSKVLFLLDEGNFAKPENWKKWKCFYWNRNIILEIKKTKKKKKKLIGSKTTFLVKSFIKGVKQRKKRKQEKI